MRRALWLFAMLLLACGDDVSTRPDAGDGAITDTGPTPRPDGAADAAPDSGTGVPIDPPAAPELPAAPEPPAMPLPPATTTCRAGFTLAPSGDHCLPAEVPAAGCADDEALFLGDTACSRIGAACGADGWPTDLPPTGVRYVRAGAASGGDGTRARPFATIADALAGATSGTVVALAAGRYEEEVAITVPGVTLWGACVAQTTVAAPAIGADVATIRVEVAGVVVRNLRLEVAGLIASGAAASVTVEDVLTVGVFGWSFLADEGAMVSGRNLVARDQTEVPERRGDVFIADNMGTFVLERGVAERCVRAIGAFEGARIEVRDVSVRDVTGDFASGVNYGGVMVAHGLLIERSMTYPFMVSGEASSAELDDVFVRDAPYSVVANFAAPLVVSHLTVVRVGLGPHAYHANSSIHASDVVARDVDMYGLSVADHATLVAERVRVVGSGFEGISAREGATAMLADVDVEDVAASGIHASSDAHLEITNAAVARSSVAAVRVEGAATTLKIDDLSVREGRVDDTGTGGIGVSASLGATLDLGRLAITDALETGLFVAGEGTTASIADLAIDGTAALPDGSAGRGIELRDSASLSIMRARVARTDAEALLVTGAPRGLTVLDLDVADAGRTDGAAVSVDSGAHLTVSRLRVASARGSACVASGRDTALDLGPLVVQGAGGDGLVVTDAAALALGPSSFAGVAGRALVLGAGAAAPDELADVAITGVGAAGIVVRHGAPLALRRVAVTGSGAVAVLVGERGTTLDVSQLAVGAADEAPARGLEVGLGARVVASAVRIDGAREVAILASGAATDVSVSDVMLDAAAIGASVGSGASMELERFVVRDGSVAGLQVALGGDLDLRRGEVRDNQVGANVQDPAFDVRRLTLDEVVFAGNEADVSVDPLPIPSPTP